MKISTINKIAYEPSETSRTILLKVHTKRNKDKTGRERVNLQQLLDEAVGLLNKK